MSEKKKVEVFDLSNMNDKMAYEKIINTYLVIREEFAYMRDGSAKVTVWYVED
jgi:hypothetical protein